jgi:hypothetical protein
MPRKPMSESDWVDKARSIHSDDYDYSKLKWISINDPVTITCNNCLTEFTHTTGKEHIRSKPRARGCPIRCKNPSISRIKDDRTMSIELDEELTGIVKTSKWLVHPKWLPLETNYKLSWICSDCNHSWSAVRQGGRGCPACAGKEVSNFDEWNSAENIHPFITNYWAKENQLLPSKVPFGSGKEFFFTCVESKCDKIHKSKLNNKVRRWYCPFCKGGGKKKGVSVWGNYPELVQMLEDKSHAETYHNCTSDLEVGWVCSSCDRTYTNKIGVQVYRSKRDLCVPCTQKWVANNRPQTTVLFSEFIQKARAIHGDKYEYIESSYTKSSSKLDMKHKICGIIESRSGNSHLQGAGCTRCAEYGFDRQSPAEYYAHKIVRKENKELVAYKGGISNNWRVRIQVLKRHLPADLEIFNIGYVSFETGQEAWNLERKLLAVKKIRYDMLNFQGGTELFTVNPLDYAKKESMLD